jgi:septum formation protein
MKVPSLLLSLAFSERSQSHYPFITRIGRSASSLGRTAFTLAMSTTTTTTNSNAGNATTSSSSSSSPSQLLVSLSDRLARTDDKQPSGDDSLPPPLAKLVLASQSPRRREILDMMGLANCYEVEPSPLDESKLQDELMMMGQLLSSTEYTRRLAEAKARALAEAHCQSDSTATANDAIPTLYLGSDTIVELDETILEKPKDVADAKRMLTLLSGRQHHVHTGVALYRLFQNKVEWVGSFTDTATVTFATLTERDIDAYIASGEPMDKAGSYGIQGIGGQFVTTIQGDFFTVMGMPMHQTSRIVALALQEEATTTRQVERKR